MQKFDVVIVGGAITGSVLALTLSSATQHKIQIAIIEKSLPNYAEQGGFDARSIALSQGSVKRLAKTTPVAGSNLAALLAPISTPIQQIHVSDQFHFGKTILNAQELNLPQLGVVVELEKMGKMLNEWLQKQHNIQIFCPDTVTAVERTADKCQLTLASQQNIECQLLVCADGIQSKIAKMCGVDTVMVKDYGQSAIIANVELEEHHQYQAFERFTAQGPFALLPLNQKMMSLVWCVADPAPLVALQDEAFLTALQSQFGWKLGKFQRVSKRFVYPLSSQKAESHIHHRLAIVGNAAQLLHPVAGQGFNLGMRDLFALSQLVSEWFNQGQDIGDYALLTTFEQCRQQDQQRVMALTSGLISLFCHDALPAQIARNIGLIAASHSKLLRTQIAHQALGW